MKISDTVLLSQFMRDNEKCNISHAPAWAVLNLNTKCIGVIDPEGPEKNNTEMKSVRLFTAATQHLTTLAVNIKFREILFEGNCLRW